MVADGKKTMAIPAGQYNVGADGTNRAPIASVYTGTRVHMVGVGGSGMQALAGLLLRHGAHVSGSDVQPSDTLDRLADAGATIHVGHAAGHVPEIVDHAVASAAVPMTNPELVAARARGASVLTYAQMLGALMRLRTGIAVAGTHGKSTTTAMTAYVLAKAGLDPSFVVGAVVDQLGGASRAGEGEYFVAEACEYERSFLNLTPRYGVILNIEEDHLDYYHDMDDIVNAFAAFAIGTTLDGVVIANGDDPMVARAIRDVDRPIETFGSSTECTWQATDLRLRDGRYAFDVNRKGRRVFESHLGLAGMHNVHNALAAAAVAWQCGVRGDVIGPALAEFGGVQRRMTLRGVQRGVTVMDDYAHHPTEIQATLQAARQLVQPKRLCVIFQPHQHSRTRFLMEEFARSFTVADEVVVPKIYFVRDSEQERAAVCAQDLVDQLRDHGRSARHFATFDEIVDHVVDYVESGDMVMTMGAGDVWKVADELIRRLG